METIEIVSTEQQIYNIIKDTFEANKVFPLSKVEVYLCGSFVLSKCRLLDRRYNDLDFKISILPCQKSYWEQRRIVRAKDRKYEIELFELIKLAFPDADVTTNGEQYDLEIVQANTILGYEVDFFNAVDFVPCGLHYYGIPIEDPFSILGEKINLAHSGKKKHQKDLDRLVHRLFMKHNYTKYVINFIKQPLWWVIKLASKYNSFMHVFKVNSSAEFRRARHRDLFLLMLIEAMGKPEQKRMKQFMLSDNTVDHDLYFVMKNPQLIEFLKQLIKEIEDEKIDFKPLDDDDDLPF